MSMRRMIALVFVVGVSAALFAMLQGSNATTEPGGQSAAGLPPTQSQPKNPVARPPTKPLFDGWNKPAAVLVLSGQQHGYIEPCGCSAVQLGGVSRRASLIRQIEERGWPVAAIDVGGVASARRHRKQSQVKFEKTLAALQFMKYAAVALGPEDLHVGPADYVMGVGVNLGDMPFLAANVVLLGSPDLGTPVRRKTVQVGDVKIALTGVVGESIKKEIFPPPVKGQPTGGNSDDITISDPIAALTKVLAEIDADKPDLRVLLSHARLDESKSIAEKFANRFDLILSAGGPEDPDGKPIRIGRTMIVTTGAKGKHVGVVGLFPKADAKDRLRFELIDMDGDRFKNTREMDDLMREYQAELQRLDLVGKEPTTKHPTGSNFVGAATCGECHTKAYAKWKTTKHAHGYDSLIEGRPELKDRWVSRIHDPECLACHVTGWDPKQFQRYESGFLSATATAQLKGNQCENCHGPGSKHVAAEREFKKTKKETDELLELREARHLDLELAKERVCYSCHDGDNSPDFDFKKYWPQIAHPGMD
jgi:hypothetical protein